MIACFWAQRDSQREREREAGLPDYLFARTLMIYAPTFHLLHIIRGKPATVSDPAQRIPCRLCEEMAVLLGAGAGGVGGRLETGFIYLSICSLARVRPKTFAE